MFLSLLHKKWKSLIIFPKQSLKCQGQHFLYFREITNLQSTYPQNAQAKNRLKAKTYSLVWIIQFMWIYTCLLFMYTLLQIFPPLQKKLVFAILTNHPCNYTCECLKQSWCIISIYARCIFNWRNFKTKSICMFHA